MQRQIKLCVNVMTENSEIRGPNRYTYELIRHLDTSLFNVTLIAGIWQREVYRELENRVRVLYFDINRGKLYRALFFIFAMPCILRKHSIDVFHLPATNPLPLLSIGTKIVSTIHDTAEFIVPVRFGRLQSLYRICVELIQAHCSDGLITVSHSSKADLVKYLRVKPERIEVIHNGATALDANAMVEGLGLHIHTNYLYCMSVCWRMERMLIDWSLHLEACRLILETRLTCT